MCTHRDAADTLYGDAGDDDLDGEDGTDSLDGGAGLNDPQYVDKAWFGPNDPVIRTGWPRAVFRPGLPQTRTCAINAFGSSSYPFATLRYREWITPKYGKG